MGDSMHKFMIVFKHEYALVVKKKSFIVGLILTPLLMGLMMFAPILIEKFNEKKTEHLAVIDRTNLDIGKKFVENLEVYTLDDSVTASFIVENLYVIDAFDVDEFNTTKDSLKNLISEGNLKYLVVITPDAVTTDTGVYVVASNENISANRKFRWQLTKVISSLRLEASNVNIPIDSVLNMTQRIDLIAKDLKGVTVSYEIQLFIAIVFVMLMYMLIILNGQMVMRSVIDEKTSRIMEVLVSSVTPFQLMLGKIFGLGAATLTQVAIWVIAGYTIFALNPIQSTMLNGILTPFLLIFILLFFILGFLLYSTLFALLGSIVDTEKEAQNFLVPIIMCLMVPVMLSSLIIDDPNSLVVRIMSFIPMFTPTTMVMRLNFLFPSLPNNSLFQPAVLESILTLIVLAATVLGTIWLTSKIFRMGILMHGKRATLPEIIKWIRK